MNGQARVTVELDELDHEAFPWSVAVDEGAGLVPSARYPDLHSAIGAALGAARDVGAGRVELDIRGLFGPRF